MNGDDATVRAADMKPALAPRFYRSQELFEVERQRIFNTQWFCVGRAEQLANRGDYLLVSVAGESVIVVRARADALRAFYNVCRHRGSRLLGAPGQSALTGNAAECSGHLEGAIVCPYHAWSYSLDGGLRGAPFVRFDEACPKEKFSLVQVHLEEWGGFICLNLAEQPAQSLREQVGPVAERLSRYPLEEMRRGAQLVYDVRANWKILVENYNECYHCGPVHPELCALVPAFRQNGGASLEWNDGIPHRAGAWTFTASGTSTRAPFPGLSEREKTHHKGEVVYPNLWLSMAAEHVAAFTLWPIEPGLTRIACDFLFHHSETSKPGFDPTDVVQFWDVVNRQDWVRCESVHDGMSSRGFRGAFYAPMEDPSLDMRRYLEKHLGEITEEPR
jgi:glycine betaine catabolism A